MAALPAFDALLRERGLAGRAATRSSTAPVLDWYGGAIRGLRTDAIPYNAAVFDFIRSNDIRTVVLVARWSSYLEADCGGGSTFQDAVAGTIHRLAACGVQPVVLLDVPSFSFNVPHALALSCMRGMSVNSDKSVLPKNDEMRFDSDFGRKITATGACIVDPKPAFKIEGGGYEIQRTGRALYTDGHHLSTAGAVLVLLPLLRSALPLPMGTPHVSLL